MENGGMKIIIFNTGYCFGPGKIAYRTKSWKKVRFSARIFLIQTKKYGNILFDAGYAKTYLDDIAPLYNWLLPVHISNTDTLKKQLKDQNIALSDIAYVFISHFHADHVAGLKELKGIPWIYREDALKRLQQMGKPRAFKHGFFSAMIPDIPKGSIALLETDFKKPFLNSDLRTCLLFNDSNFQAIDLPGHALGQMGLCIENTFFVADAVWSKEAIATNIMPSLIGLLLQANRKKYLHTFQQIQKITQKHPKLTCLPTHIMREI